ncbi:MAG: Ig-like domain-containing protein [Bacillota bacterium]
MLKRKALILCLAGLLAIACLVVPAGAAVDLGGSGLLNGLLGGLLNTGGLSATSEDGQGLLNGGNSGLLGGLLGSLLNTGGLSATSEDGQGLLSAGNSGLLGGLSGGLLNTVGMSTTSEDGQGLLGDLLKVDLGGDGLLNLDVTVDDLLRLQLDLPPEGGQNGGLLGGLLGGVLGTLLPSADTRAPTVTGTDPTNGATGVPVDKTIKVTFSEEVRQGETYDQISLKDDQDRDVTFTKQLTGNELTVDPTNNLKYGTSYKVNIPAGAVKDAAGNKLKEAYTFSFRTGSSGATGAPVVTRTDPANGATGVPVDKTIGVAFSEYVQIGDNYNLITLRDGEGKDVAFTKGIVGNILVIDPTGNLKYDTSYKVNIPAGAVEDTEGNELAEAYTFSFRTGSSGATGAPVVTDTDPEDGDTNVPVDKTIWVTFSEYIQEGDDYDRITLRDDEDEDVDFTKMIIGNFLFINPTDNLEARTYYEVKIPAGAVEDDAGNELEKAYTFSFRTGSSATGAPEVNGYRPCERCNRRAGE